MVALPGVSLDEASRRFLHDVRPAAVILLGSNVRSYEQTKDFISQIKEAEGFGAGIADFPLIAVDQEGGEVNRLHLSPAPSARELGNRGKPEETRKVAFGYAKVCRELGIAIVLAPVLDVFEPGANDFLSTRTFSTDPEVVTTMGRAFADGLMEGGVLPVGKHFPGHGSASEDSHKKLAVVRKDKEELESTLYPFKKAIESAFPALMVGHISCPALDPEGIPASLSRPIIQGFLRGDLAFDGLVLTDDMNMRAVTAARPLEQAVVEALAAGCDMAIICIGELPRYAAVNKAIMRAQANGVLSLEATQGTSRRLRTLQEWLRFTSIALMYEAHATGKDSGGKERVESPPARMIEHSLSSPSNGEMPPTSEEVEGRIPNMVVPIPGTEYPSPQQKLRPLSAEEAGLLEKNDWGSRVGGSCAVWISVDEQKLRLIKEDVVQYEVRCSTARNGTGSEMNSNKTPLGWHAVAEKHGEGVEWGAIFRNTQLTKQIWKRGQKTEEDLILTRVLVLDGLEPGKNKGGNRDSKTRGIYIHGTNDEEEIGTPTSHGCIRLQNNDVITAFERLATGTLVLITEKEEEPDQDD